MIDPPLGGKGSERPRVSVVVPFAGSTGELSAAVARLRFLALLSGDELIVADNTKDAESRGSFDGVRVVPAGDHPSSYYARNVGAELAKNEWILFVDADCEPRRELLDEYFRHPIDANTAAIAGEIRPHGEAPLSRYAVSRGVLNQEQNLRHAFLPAAVTANLLVRRTAWHSVGGFQEGIRSGGDTEFCWRLQERGWAIEYRREAWVSHRHRETLRALTRQIARHSAGAAWINRRYPNSMPRPRLLRGLARAAVGVIVWTLSGRFERARFKAIDAAVLIAASVGFLCGNSSRRTRVPARPGGVAVFADSFPRLSETFVSGEVRALQRLGVVVRVEALSRPDRPLRGGIRGLQVNYREDDSLLRRLIDGSWLILRHPLRASRDALSQGRWRRGGDHVTRLPSIALVARRITLRGDHHLHAHFATSAALEAMRLSRLLGVPYSTAPHAIEIFARPANLVEKLEGARFISTDCQYNVRHLSHLVDDGTAERIHEIVLGIDESRFTRTRPLQGGRVVGSVGRLVGKKGFADLIDAVARLEDSDRAVDSLAIAGDGPLRESLEAFAAARGVRERVRFLGALEPDEVLEFMHGIDVFALPCVVAPDGDRDSMPVVVKEALALEIPVVGTDEVGLPEMIRPEWGRLVPVADPDALADAIDQLLDLPVTERSAMGAKGRAFVLEHCNIDREAEKVARLIAS